METKFSYTIVGAFVIFLLTAMVFSIIWLSSGLSLQKYKVYKLYMMESVSGLSIDSPVEFNGVNMGTVQSISVDQNNPRTVIVLVRIKDATPVTLGTTATLNTRGVTGTAYIALNDEGANITRLQPTADDPYPVIKTTPSLYMRMDTALREATLNLKKISTIFQTALDTENLNALKKTFLNLRDITNMIVANSQRINMILQNTARASTAFPATLKSTQSSLQQVNQMILPSAERTLNNLNSAVTSISDLTTEVRENPTVLIRGRAPETLGPGEK